MSDIKEEFAEVPLILRIPIEILLAIFTVGVLALVAVYIVISVVMAIIANIADPFYNYYRRNLR